MIKSTHIPLESLTNKDLQKIMGIAVDLGIPVRQTHLKTMLTDPNWMRRNISSNYPRPHVVRLDGDQQRLCLYERDGKLYVEPSFTGDYTKEMKRFDEEIDRIFGH